MHNTGPRRYNIRKRAQVKRIGYKLNQEGIWCDDGYKVISVETDKTYHCDTEQKVYDFFGWDYCKPEDRK
jgi:DNA polymerase/3'-5' exonuclease PolX